VQPCLKVLTHRALQMVDEIGYLQIRRTGAMLFFQLPARRIDDLDVEPPHRPL
jgi:hypothetical protein